MRPVLRIALFAVLAAGLSSALASCGVMGELDDANKKMGIGGPQKPDPSEAEKGTAPKKPEPGVFDKVLAWTKKSTEPAPKKHDPNDPIVKCETRGSLSFVYKFDCLHKGGGVVGDHKA
jgi:hypothetical protein